MFGFEPFAVATALMGAAGRQFDPADERDAGTVVVERPVFGEDRQVADAADVAEVDGFVDRLGLAEMIAADVRQLGQRSSAGG